MLFQPMPDPQIQDKPAKSPLHSVKFDFWAKRILPGTFRFARFRPDEVREQIPDYFKGSGLDKLSDEELKKLDLYFVQFQSCLCLVCEGYGIPKLKEHDLTKGLENFVVQASFLTDTFKPMDIEFFFTATDRTWEKEMEKLQEAVAEAQHDKVCKRTIADCDSARNGCRLCRALGNTREKFEIPLTRQVLNRVDRLRPAWPGPNPPPSFRRYRTGVIGKRMVGECRSCMYDNWFLQRIPLTLVKS